MGYIVNNSIAKITAEPDKVSFSSNPNFVEFSRLDRSDKNKKVDVYLKIINGGIGIDKPVSARTSVFNNMETERLGNDTVTPDIDFIDELPPSVILPPDLKPLEIRVIPVPFRISIIETKTNIVHTFEGTDDLKELNDKKFYTFRKTKKPLKSQLLKSAESLRECFFKNTFLRSNFEITLVLENGKPIPAIHIQSKGVGEEYEFKISMDEDLKSVMTYNDSVFNSKSNDSISSGFSNTEIQLFVQKDSGVFLGQDDKPDKMNVGAYIATLSKSYIGDPLWFDVNVLKAPVFSTDFLSSDSWCNAGTVQDYRFYAKRYISDTRKYENDLFYYSDVLYNITGYKRNLEEIDLSDYIYYTDRNNIIKPLTHQPELFHIKGQSQYFNFILSDPNHQTNNIEIAVCYDLFSKSGRKLGDSRIGQHKTTNQSLHIVNTLKLDIDDFLIDDNVGYVEVFLTANNKKISYPLCFNILPEHLYNVHDFAFLNSLGGWSSFNFAGTTSSDFKTSTETIYKTQAPNYSISSEIESVHSKEVTEKYTVQTMPLTARVYDWLKELSSSVAVYELSTKRYVIVDELNIKQNTKDDLFVLEMKYHYSDSYNARIK